jgi:DNA-binding MarR family transcriptional regulator
LDKDYQIQADFRCAYRHFQRYAEEQARAAGITPQHYFLLLVVRGHRNHPRVNIGEIADALQIRHHGASLLVDRCVKRGLLERTEDPNDRRRVHVWLTPEGQKILDRVMEANRRKMGSLGDTLFPDALREAIAVYQDQDDLTDEDESTPARAG